MEARYSVEAIVAEVEAGIKELESKLESSSGGSWLRGYEEGVRQVLNRAGTRLLEERIHLTEECGGGARFCSECGERMRNVRRAEITVQSFFGPVRVNRTHYHCRPCGRSEYPVDEAYGWREHRFTPLAKDWICYTTQKEAYEESARTLDRVSGMEVTGETCRAVTQTCGKALLQRRREQVRQMYELPEVLEAESAPTPRMLVGVDGCHVLKSGDAVGRPAGKVQGERRKGRKRKGKSKRQGERRPEGERGMEVKVGVIGALERRQGREYTIEQKGYVTSFEDVEVFADWVYCESLQRGVAQAKEVVVLGDGAPWIWQRIAPLYENRIEILDWYHVSEKVWETGETVYGSREKWPTQNWVKRQLERLLEGEIDAVLETVRTRRKKEETTEKPREPALTALNKLERYVTENRKRMDYPRYRRLGLPEGSGCVESTCGFLVADRMKESGMQWRKESAAPLLHLRAEYKSDRWDEAWEYLANAA